jgi:hypothetical protein
MARESHSAARNDGALLAYVVIVVAVGMLIFGWIHRPERWWRR